ncbi:protein phosphatase 1L-like [Mytilus californianus]|uniref:protein phosphatase 1L-like n=1 Tax=Mytilus californianus TaxID=6549 RepID=UPI0022482C11|nr:protein phosphatase 1L-like [Mytilus californianus]
MTLTAVVSRYIRKYLFSQELVLTCIFLLILYQSVFHVKPIWRYLRRTKLNIQLRWQGQYNSSKVQDSHLLNSSGENDVWETKKGNAAVYAIQGRRPHMEDRFSIVYDLEHTKSSIYGIFDGHGGEFAADFVEKTLFKKMMIRLLKSSLDHSQVNISQMIMQEMLDVDDQLLKVTRSNMDISGTTAVLALVQDGTLTVANVGDSRGVLCDKAGQAVPVSFDHKPHLVQERQRIRNAGGFISFNGVWRVAGILAMSRALGDYPLKDKNLVIANPDILTFNISDLQPPFMILATDGLWDVFSNQEAVDYISERLHEPHYGAKSLVLQAYYRGSLDNISVLVVNFKEKKSASFDKQPNR